MSIWRSRRRSGAIRPTGSGFTNGGSRRRVLSKGAFRRRPMKEAVPEVDLERPRKILVRGVNWLGDAVMTTAALQRLREARPLDSITLLADAKLAGLWSGYPLVDRVLSFARSEG